MLCVMERSIGSRSPVIAVVGMVAVRVNRALGSEEVLSFDFIRSVREGGEGLR